MPKRLLTPTDLCRALTLIDRELRAPVELIIIGGAALALYYGSNRPTEDIDAIEYRGSTYPVELASALVADWQGFPRSWFNFEAMPFLGVLSPDHQKRLQSMPLDFRHLRLFALGLPDQVALKLVADRDKDKGDLELLLPLMTEADWRIVEQSLLYALASPHPEVVKLGQRLAAGLDKWGRKL